MDRDRRAMWPWFAAALVALVFAVAFAAARVAGLQGPALPNQTGGRTAPAFAGISHWLNSDPLTMADLRGDVVLIDFWTYSCINCIRTFPHLRALDARYAPFGLRIVGVHSPEFAFERDVGNVRSAIAKYGLTYPVAMDDQMATWRAYGNRYWPRVYLIDADGVIRYDHVGEGGEDELQAEIRRLLTDAGKTLPPPVTFDDTAPTAHITPEIYAGLDRGSVQGGLANPEGYAQGVVRYAAVPAGRVARAGTAGAFFLEGSWRIEDEYVEAASDDAAIVLPFLARDAFIVASAEQARARVLLDGAPISGALAGGDVEEGAVGVDHADLYALVHAPTPEEHVLRLEVSPGFRFYTFTFG